MTDTEKRIVRAYSALVRRDVLPTYVAVAAYADLGVAEVARLVPRLRQIGQLPS